MDYQGLAILLTAFGVFLVNVGTAIIAFLTYLKGRTNETKLKEVHELVNGQSEALRTAVGQAAFSEGKAVWAEQERQKT